MIPERANDDMRNSSSKHSSEKQSENSSIIMLLAEDKREERKEERDDMILVPCDSDSSVYSFVDECISINSLKKSANNFVPLKAMEEAKGQPEFTARNLEQMDKEIRERRQ